MRHVAASRPDLVIGAICGAVLLMFMTSIPVTASLPEGAQATANHAVPDERLALSDVDTPKPGVPGDGGLLVPQNSDIGDSLSTPDFDKPIDDTLETDVVDPEQPPEEAFSVTVGYDLTQLPRPVQRMRELIVEAAAKGDLEALRPLLGTGPTRTELSITGYEGDPVEFLREMSGDGEGHETLAILLDILNAGYAHIDPGEPTELFLWPYFYSVPLDSLDGRQRVELFRIITAGDYEDMRAFGGYIFYRAAIGPDGDWKFFVAGD